MEIAQNRLYRVALFVYKQNSDREHLAKAMPDCIKKSISAGIGLFIAFPGFQKVGIITNNDYTLVQFVKLNVITDIKWSDVAEPVIALFGGLLCYTVRPPTHSGAIFLQKRKDGKSKILRSILSVIFCRGKQSLL